MLIISLVCSLLMLTFVNLWVCRSQRVGSAAWSAWPFLVLGVCPVFALPTYMLNVFLVAVVGMVCMAFSMRRHVFILGSLLATLVSYGVGVYFAVEHVREEANLYPYESLEERLSYESRRDELPPRLGLTSPGETGGAFDEDRLAEIDAAIKRDEFHPRSNWGHDSRTSALEEMHDHQLQQFIRSPSFGVARMMSPRFFARLPEQDTVPMSSLASSSSGTLRGHDRPRTLTAELGWELHRDSISNFLSPTRFGYTKDRRHVAGFQSHQFNSPPDMRQDAGAPQRYELRRLELVSLLKHVQPGVYITENLPRMDELQDVPIRPLDTFEREHLRRLWRGDDLAVQEQGNRLRMLGAIRAGKQCLSCHDAQRGDLLGAFSYHLVEVR